MRPDRWCEDGRVTRRHDDNGSTWVHLNSRLPPAKTRRRPAAGEPPGSRSVTTKPIARKTLSAGQRAYEERRAAKAGMTLDKWLSSKQRQQEAEQRARQKVVEAAKPPKKPGLFSRLLERAQRPFGG